MSAFLHSTPLSSSSFQPSSSPLVSPRCPNSKSSYRHFHSKSPQASLHEVLIIGNGAAALSTAFHLLLSGVRPHIVHTPSLKPAALAAAGMVAPSVDIYPPPPPIPPSSHIPLHTLCRISRATYPAFLEDLSRHSSIDPAFASCDDVLIPHLDSAPPNALLRPAMNIIEPALGPKVRAVTRAKGDAHIDPRLLHQALQEACASMGAGTTEGVVSRLEFAPDGRTILGIHVEGVGLMRANHYVLAAGAWSRRLLPPLPIRPVKGQMICLAPMEGGRGELAHMLHGERVYVVPRKGQEEYFIGATMEEGVWDVKNSAARINSLLEAAMELVPSFAEYEIKEMWAGLRPAAPDLLPVFGGGGYTNMTVATGWYRNGIMLTPSGGDITAALAMGEVGRLEKYVQDLLPFFSMDRFYGEEQTPDEQQIQNVQTEKQASQQVEEIPISVNTERKNNEDTSPTYQGADNNRYVSLGESISNEQEEDTRDIDPNDIQVFRVLPDGSTQAVMPSKEFLAMNKSSSSSEAENVTSQLPTEKNINAKKPDITAAHADSTQTNRGAQNESFSYELHVPNPETVNADNDAYEDVMQYRGAGMQDVMDKALEKNRVFGRTKSSLEKEGVPGLSLSEEEVIAFDKALEDGLKDMEDAAYAYDKGHASVIATATEQASANDTDVGHTLGKNGLEKIALGKDELPQAVLSSEGYY